MHTSLLRPSLCPCLARTGPYLSLRTRWPALRPRAAGSEGGLDPDLDGAAPDPKPRRGRGRPRRAAPGDEPSAPVSLAALCAPQPDPRKDPQPQEAAREQEGGAQGLDQGLTLAQRRAGRKRAQPAAAPLPHPASSQPLPSPPISTAEALGATSAPLGSAEGAGRSEDTQRWGLGAWERVPAVAVMTVEPQSTEAEAEAEARLEAELEAELHAEAEEAGSSGDDVLGGSSEEGGRASGARKQGVETPPVTFRSLTDLRQQLQSAKGTRPVDRGARAAAGGAGAGAGARGVAGWGAAAGARPALGAGPPAATAARPTAPAAAAAAAAAPSRPQAVRPPLPPPASSTASSAPPRRSNSPLRKPVTSFPSPSSLSLGPASATTTSSSTQPQPRAVTPPRASIFPTARPAQGTGTPVGSWAAAPGPDTGSRTPAVSAGLTSASRGFLSEDEEYDLYGMDDDDASGLTDDDGDGPLRFDSLAPRPIPGALSAAEYAELERDPAYAKAKAYALSVVQRTAVSCAELALKLQARGAAPEHASALVGWLSAQGLLNDALFAQLFVQSKWTSKLLAPAKIKHELLSAKSVAPSAVDAALAAVFGPSRSIRLTGPASRQETEVREALVAAARKHVERGRSSKLKAPAAGSQAANAAALAQAKARERDSQRRRLSTWLMYRGHSVDIVTAMIRVLGL